MFGDFQKPVCAYCGEPFVPRVTDQRFCRWSCRKRGKALEARSARRVWIEQGRPMQPEAVVEQPEGGVVRRRTVWPRLPASSPWAQPGPGLEPPLMRDVNALGERRRKS